MGKGRASIDKSRSKKVGLKRDSAKGSVSDGQEAAGRAPNVPRDESGLTKEKLDEIFAESDPHRQFELFAGCLGMPQVESMSILTRTATEYDYLNVMFCREQNFTAEQTIAFRDMAGSIFEAAIVRGELLGPTEAFQAFTERLLPFATVGPQNNTQLHSAEAASATPLASEGVNTEGDGGHLSLASGGTSAGKKGSREKIVKKRASGMSQTSETSSGVEATTGANEAITDPRAEHNSKPSGERKTPLFSVSDVAVITEFVSRGLYRHFTLYRMCFTAEPTRVCREVRIVQVETPLAPPPLRESEEARLS